MISCHAFFACFPFPRIPVLRDTSKNMNLAYIISRICWSRSIYFVNTGGALRWATTLAHPDYALAAALVQTWRTTHHICPHGLSWLASDDFQENLILPWFLYLYHTRRFPASEPYRLHLQTLVQLNRDNRPIPGFICPPTDVDTAESVPEGAESSVDSDLTAFRSAFECWGLPRAAGAGGAPDAAGFGGSPAWCGHRPQVDIVTLPRSHGFLVSRKALK